MIAMPQQQSNNLGSALAMWNQFMQPGQPQPQQANDPGGEIGAGKPPQLQTPQAQNWAIANAASQGGTPNNGVISQPQDNSGNLAKAAGAAGGSGLSGLLGSI
jgi:hypothetical protein